MPCDQDDTVVAVGTAPDGHVANTTTQSTKIQLVLVSISAASITGFMVRGLLYNLYRGNTSIRNPCSPSY